MVVFVFAIILFCRQTMPYTQISQRACKTRNRHDNKGADNSAPCKCGEAQLGCIKRRCGHDCLQARIPVSGSLLADVPPSYRPDSFGVPPEDSRTELTSYSFRFFRLLQLSFRRHPPQPQLQSSLRRLRRMTQITAASTITPTTVHCR